jgi:hypothetical protein
MQRLDEDHITISLTPRQLANTNAILEMLKQGLPKELDFDITQYVSKELDFDITQYVSTGYSPSNYESYEPYQVKEGRAEQGVFCGTSCCILGYAAIREIGTPELYKTWGAYSRKEFGADNSLFSPEGNAIFEWCYAASWSGFDRTVEGAIKRIEYMLEYMEVPVEFSHQAVVTAWANEEV